jgi:NitT/TauT family transport system substrate-binding protein
MRAVCLALAAALAAAPAAAKPWRHGVVAPGADAGFAMMAEKGGFADHQGLELEIATFPNGALALAALRSGDIDSLEGAPVMAFLADKRDDLRIIGCSWLGVTESVFARPSILAAKDLEGQFIAAAAPGELPDLVAEAYLAANTVPVALVRFTRYEGDAARYAALEAGAAAAAAVSLEYLPLAEHVGLKLAARGSDLLPNAVRRCLMASAHTLYARREDAIRFLAAEMTALAHALKSRDTETALARAAAGLSRDDPRPAAIFAEAARAGGLAPSLPVPLDRLAAMEALLVKSGALAHEFDPHDIVDDDLGEEARDRIAHE